MNMIRQDDRCLDLEGMSYLDGSNSLAQQRDIFILGEDFPPLEGDHGEEESPTGNEDAAILHIEIITICWVSLDATEQRPVNPTYDYNW